MSLALKKTVIVQAGGRIEFEMPELAQGATAEVIVLYEERPSRPRLSSFIGTGKGAFLTPEEGDDFIRQERDAWER